MNVLLVVMDSVSAKNMSLYGYERETTPWLETWATNDGVTVYEEARAPGRWSLPSHASMFTGLHASEHRLFDRTQRLTIPTLWDELEFPCAVFTKNSYISGLVDTGLSAGFDTIVTKELPFDGLDPYSYSGNTEKYLKDALRSENKIGSLLNGAFAKFNLLGWTTDDYYVERFNEWSNTHEEWGACINLMGAHVSHNADRSCDWVDEESIDLQTRVDASSRWELIDDGDIHIFDELENLYDASIRKVDKRVKEIVESVDLSETLVVVTSDHGHAFGEKSEFRDVRLGGHGVGMSETLLHVPLIVSYPDGIETSDDPTALSSLTYFYDVVSESLQKGTPAFNGVTRAGDGGMNKSNPELWESLGSPPELSGDVFVRYHHDGEDVIKSILWDGEVFEVNVRTNEVSEGNSEDMNIPKPKTVTSDSEELSDEAREQLKDLGYI